jgi:RNA polymerase sigma factor (sigma-70 family)
MSGRDPFANPAELIRRVYAYVAYRIGPGADAEDVTGEVFERALRYRDSYDAARGEPIPWLLGIARHCIHDHALRNARSIALETWQEISSEDVQADAIERLTVAAAVAQLDERARDLLALRYGADLTARQIGELCGLKTNAVEVALHRALARVRAELERPQAPAGASVADAAPRPST